MTDATEFVGEEMRKKAAETCEQCNHLLSNHSDAFCVEDCIECLADSDAEPPDAMLLAKETFE